VPPIAIQAVPRHQQPSKVNQIGDVAGVTFRKFQSAVEPFGSKLSENGTSQIWTSWGVPSFGQPLVLRQSQQELDLLWCLGFRVSGFGFRVSGAGFRVQGFGFQVSG